MGLDVYLYRYRDYSDTEAREAAYEAESERIWERIGAGIEYKDLSDDQKEAARGEARTLAASLALDEWGDDKEGKEQIELPSAKYPEHMFKIGYFRSSYNDGGIDRILSDRIGCTLSDIMGAGDGYKFQPDWSVCLQRARAALAAFREVTGRDGFYRVLTESVNPFGRHPTSKEILSQADALRAVAEQRKRWLDHPDPDPFGDWYSNGTGTFGKSPLRVVGVMIGRGFADMPTAYVVYEADDFDWYEQALEIVAETCEWVLAQPDVPQFYLHWSS